MRRPQNAHPRNLRRWRTTNRAATPSLAGNLDCRRRRKHQKWRFRLDFIRPTRITTRVEEALGERAETTKKSFLFIIIIIILIGK